MCSRCWKTGPFKIVTNKSTSFRIPVCDNFLFIAEMMHISAENNKCILSPCQEHCKRFPVVFFCLSLYQRATATQQLPNDVSWVVIIYWRDLSPQGGLGDLQYLRCSCFWRRWHVPKCSCECCHSHRCHRLLSVLQPDYWENLKISLHIQGTKQVHQQMNECEQCVRICVSQPLCV